MKKLYLLFFVCIKAYAQIPAFNNTPKYLDKNHVRARINTVNNKFWNIGANNFPSYEVPRGSGRNAQFANSIWIGGFDAGGQLHMSANTYRQLGADFWPGPIDTTNFTAVNYTNSNTYNKLWKVDCNDISAFATAYNTGSVTAGTYTVPPDLLTYPAKGIANFQKNLEPFMDANNNGLYDPVLDGDYPIIKGQQQILSIFNDNYSLHGETQAPAMGLEIHERSYAYFQPTIDDTMQAINYTTFYHYTIYNRSNTNYNQVLLSDWVDVDLGYYLNDYIGTDTVNNFAYCYNGNNTDPSITNVPGYGNKPPVISSAILKTNCANDGIDNNVNGTIDEPGETFVLNRTSYYNNNINQFPVATTNPNTAVQYYNFMNDVWKDNSPFMYGGTAFGGTTTPTHYVYTGDPELQTGWTEGTAGNAYGDRRVIITSGPFNFPAQSKIEWGYAIVFSQDTTQPINTITRFHKRVQRDVRNALYYDQTHQAPECAPQVISTNPVGIATVKAPVLKTMVYPNPANDRVTIDLSENVRSATVNLVDLTGRKLLEEHITSGYRACMDVSTLSPGIYFIEVTSGSRSSVEKIVKY